LSNERKHVNLPEPSAIHHSTYRYGSLRSFVIYVPNSIQGLRAHCPSPSNHKSISSKYSSLHSYDCKVTNKGISDDRFMDLIGNPSNHRECRNGQTNIVGYIIEEKGYSKKKYIVKANPSRGRGIDNGKTMVMASGYGINYEIGICGRSANAIENLFLSALHIFKRGHMCIRFQTKHGKPFTVRTDSRIE